MNNISKKIVVLAISANALYGLWRRYRAGNQVISCKVDKTSGSSTVEDHLSELPEEILSHILSFLSLREVARLATLSKNWSRMSLTYPYLHLDWHEMSGNSGLGLLESFLYVNNVNQMLQRFRNMNFLSIRLQCLLKNNYAANVNRWLSYVASRKGLQSLTLSFEYKSDYGGVFIVEYNKLHLISSSFLLHFHYLNHLHLFSCILNIEEGFKLTTLATLTTLDLNNVILEGPNWEGLLSCSSSIEILWLRRCNLPDNLYIGNNFSSLSHLVVLGCQNLKELVLSARNLTKFDFQSLESLRCYFLDVPNLRNVYLFPQFCLKEILESLAANASSLKYLFVRRMRAQMNELPSFPARLFHSVLKLRFTVNFDDGSIMTSLPLLLKSFPLLEKLEIKLPEKVIYEVPIQVPVPCTHTNLKEIELSNFSVEDLPIATYLLESCIILNRMVITSSSRLLMGFEPWASVTYSGYYYRTEQQEFIQNGLFGKASSASAEVVIM